MKKRMKRRYEIKGKKKRMNIQRKGGKKKNNE